MAICCMYVAQSISVSVHAWLVVGIGDSGGVGVRRLGGHVVMLSGGAHWERNEHGIFSIITPLRAASATRSSGVIHLVWSGL